MTVSKYKKGKKIKTFAGFEKSTCDWFMVRIGKTRIRPLERSFVESWTYATVRKFIYDGHIWEAVLKEEGEK